MSEEPQSAPGQQLLGQPVSGQPISDRPIAEWTNETLDSMLRRALRMILVLGLIFSVILWMASNWRNAAMLAVGAAISAASTLEWGRLVHFINAKLDKKENPPGAAIAVLFLMIRLAVFAGAIYGSLRWIKGSAFALFVGLGLALLATVWEALRLLRE
jgi:hypothetical protein